MGSRTEPSFKKPSFHLQSKSPTTVLLYEPSLNSNAPGEGRSDGTASKVLVSLMADLGWIPGTQRVPGAPPGVIP